MDNFSLASRSVSADAEVEPEISEQRKRSKSDTVNCRL